MLKEGRGLIDELLTPLRDLVRVDLVFGRDLADRFFPAKASQATLALNCGAWLRRNLLIVFPLLIALL